MPTITLTISVKDLHTLRESAKQANLSPRRWAERVLNQALTRAQGNTTQRKLSRERSTARAQRQVALVRLLEERQGDPLTREEKRQLAEQYGIQERQIYRDLVVAESVANLDKKPVAPQGIDT